MADQPGEPETQPETKAESTAESERRTLPGLVVLHSPDDPEHTGAWFSAAGTDAHNPRILGRGGPQPGDEFVRLSAVRQRPNVNELLSPLASPWLSRSQLLVRMLRAGVLELERVGRSTFSVNGVETARAQVTPGDVIEIGSRFVLMVALRPERLTYDVSVAHPFGEPDAYGYVGESPAAWQLRTETGFCGSRPGHVLVLGASGTGKELIAAALHALSGRTGPLIAHNAAAFPESLVDAELFGNLKGYPNPGMAERQGLIGAADGGSLFLDEFGDLALEAQSHLLRVLDAGEYQRLGDARARRSDFRLIAATNRPESVLRPDILARFDFRLSVPDLPSRREDLPLLVRHLLRTMTGSDAALRARVFGESVWPRLSPSFVRRLVQHSFSANVRELRGLLWRSLQQSKGPELAWVEPTSGPESRAEGDEVSSLKRQMDDAERRRIMQALESCGGNQTRAAELLGISRRTLVTRLKSYAIGRKK